jgi:hypothetical protein
MRRDRAELRAKAAAAPRGTWTHDGPGGGLGLDERCYLFAEGMMISDYPRDGTGMADATADFMIAASPDVVLDLLDELEAPIPMILHCPACLTQHVDAPDERSPGWTNPPHKSHLCHGCGHVWRPCDRPTEGVKALATAGKEDSSTRAPGTFNLNDYVTFLPTPEGARLLRNNGMEAAKALEPFTGQCWAVFEALAPCLYNGGKQGIVDNRVRLGRLVP